MTPQKKAPLRKDDEGFVEYVSFRATRWIGSTGSLIFHTIMFIGSFLLYFLGLPFETILLVLTTIVSLEAIYLSIFIQMSVNRQDKRLREVSKDVGEIQEDVEDIAEDVEEMQEDVEEIQQDIDEIQEDVDEIQEDVEEIHEDEDESPSQDSNNINPEVLSRIELALKELGKEIADMRRNNTK
jgi:uncharacterized membrane protein